MVEGAAGGVVDVVEVDGGGGGGVGPSTQVSAQPSKQQRPLSGQSEGNERLPFYICLLLPGLTCVSLARTPAVTHGPLAFLLSRGGALQLRTTGTTGDSECSLHTSVEFSGGGAVNIEPGDHNCVVEVDLP